ncbi:hypothetical protein ACHAXA_007733 [Cyclostephanos tholiformis]|uniref:Fcf2 pre-rRNA processing C-terminal domain-containing protein n=1 Tax=Cyclostephanos tholiformis TaxID=382380 RepID=A0ABD3RY88_9STRA
MGNDEMITPWTDDDIVEDGDDDATAIIGSSSSSSSSSSTGRKGDSSSSTAMTSPANKMTTATATTTTTTKTRKTRKKTTASKTTTSTTVTANELTHLIPGYTAPMRLDATASLRGTSSDGIIALSELRKLASRSEAAAYAPSMTSFGVMSHPPPSSSYPRSFLPHAGGGTKRSTSTSFTTTTTATVTTTTMHRTAFGRGNAVVKSRNRGGGGACASNVDAGPGWFGMTSTPMTKTLLTDLSVIRNRNYLDPRKFYKSTDSFDGKVLQVGTVIEGGAEYYSSRLTNKERKTNLTEEVMSDKNVADYAKRKYREIQSIRDRPGRRGASKGGKGRGKR